MVVRAKETVTRALNLAARSNATSKLVMTLETMKLIIIEAKWYELVTF